MIPWRLLPLVVAGGVLGVALRQAMLLPLGGESAFRELIATTAINVLGSGALGVVLGSLGDRGAARRAFLGTGVLGGFTTYSGFAVLLVDVGRTGLALAAILCAGAALIAAGGAAIVGLRAGAAIARRRGGRAA